jgi:hypothetical protein
MNYNEKNRFANLLVEFGEKLNDCPVSEYGVLDEVIAKIHNNLYHMKDAEEVAILIKQIIENKAEREDGWAEQYEKELSDYFETFGENLWEF